jgi:hypothetical protein
MTHEYQRNETGWGHTCLLRTCLIEEQADYSLFNACPVSFEMFIPVLINQAQNSISKPL